jgi:hypothetical protein
MQLMAELAREKADVLASVAQGWNLKAHLSDAAQEVLPEGTPPARLVEVQACCGNDPNIRGLGTSAERAHALGLKDVESPGLERTRQVANLVEKQRAAMGLREQPRAISLLPRELPRERAPGGPSGP